MRSDRVFSRWITPLFLLLFSAGLGQSPIVYHISFDNRVHHEARVTITYSELQPIPLELRMSRSSPGRYSLHEFSRFVHNVEAVNSKGNILPISRDNPYQWTVEDHDGMVKLTYTLFGDQADGTYTGIDATHAHLNMPATFMWAEGHDDDPIRITFAQPGADWKIITQLATTRWSDTFTAPNLQYFMDSPTEIGAVSVREWEAGEDDHATFRLSLHHDGTEGETDAFAMVTEAIVLEERAIMGEFPEFDHGTYTFIADYLPHVAGDGMEHRNSTILTSTGSLKTRLNSLLGTVAHEFFHAWNVERIRPRALEPFDFSRANASAELWFAEGFTSYYHNLVQMRAGIIHLDRFASVLSSTVNIVHNAKGRAYYGAADMSQRAPLVDRASFPGPNNNHNTFLSYYTYGAYLGLALDLTLRGKFDEVTLDTYMAAVWRAHGKTEVPYTNANLQAILGRVTGDDQFAEEFFDDFIFSGNLPDLENLLKQGGFVLRQKSASDPWLGMPAAHENEDGGVILDRPTISGSPLYQQGLDTGDIILAVAGREVSSRDDIDDIVSEHKAGAAVEVRYKGRSDEQTVSVMLQVDPTLEVVPVEHRSEMLSDEASQFRALWLSQKGRSTPYGLERHCPICKRSYPFANEYCHYDGERLMLALEQENED